MASPTLLTAHKRLVDELTRGRGVADQLRLLLRQADIADAVSAQDLLAKILDTFAHSLSMLSADDFSQLPPAVKSEDSGDSCKTPASKDRRGCYKRKKTTESWVRETSSWLDDGHAWRKYGQKPILKAKYPRNYFRCTHKNDQGCPAQKQVQQIRDDPPLVRTTYHGKHTCKSAHQTMVDATTPDSSVIWSFQPELKFDTDVIKEEKEECYISDDLTVQFGGGGFPSPSDRDDVISSDVYSCTTSTHGSIDHMSILDDFLCEFESF